MKKTCYTLLLAALATLSPAQATEYWVLGASQTEGWYDVNKTFSQETPDSKLCWAAAASNVMAWWQDHNPEYNDLAAMGTPKGEQDIFDNFKTAFENGGGNPTFGMYWFLVGYDEQIAAGVPALTTAGKEMGGYYADAIEQVPYNIHLGNETVLAANSASIVSQYIKSTIQQGGGVALGIYGDANRDGVIDTQHAITLWGIDYNEETQMIEKMYLTDSDDIYLTNGDVATLFEAECSELEREFATVDGGSVMLKELGLTSNRSGYDWYNDTFYVGLVSSIQMKSIPVPEPDTATLGLVALAALCARRRRRSLA